MGEPYLGLSALQRLSRVIKESNSDVSGDYAVVQEAMGNICLSIGDVLQATTHFKNALAIYEVLFDAEPELIEEHYDEICDELWYIYTREDIRKERLMRSRGYSPEKVQQIFDSQLQEAVYRKHCKVVIDNNGTVEDAIRQIDLAITNMENE